MHKHVKRISAVHDSEAPIWRLSGELISTSGAILTGSIHIFCNANSGFFEGLCHFTGDMGRI